MTLIKTFQRANAAAPWATILPVPSYQSQTSSVDRNSIRFIWHVLHFIDIKQNDKDKEWTEPE